MSEQGGYSQTNEKRFIERAPRDFKRINYWVKELEKSIETIEKSKNRPEQAHVVAEDISSKILEWEYWGMRDRDTGAFKRPATNEALKRMFWRSKQHGDLTAVMFADLDKFKLINDTAGHTMGDRMIKGLVSISRDLGANVVVGRYGGEEFVVAVEGLKDPEEVLKKAEQLREMVKERLAKEINLPPEIKPEQTVSIGVVGVGDELNVHEVVTRADLAMLEAKKTRDKVVMGTVEGISKADAIKPEAVEMPLGNDIRKQNMVAEIEAKLMLPEQERRIAVYDIATKMALVEEEAILDPLTQALNKGAGLEQLSREIKADAENGYKVGVVLMDLDKFKSVNDTFGHDAGDKVLVEAVRLMQKLGEAGYKDAQVIRHGFGEELLVYCPHLHSEAEVEQFALVVGSQIRNKLTVEAGIQDKLPRVTISMSAAILDDKSAISDQIKKLDGDVQSAKDMGRDRLVMNLPDGTKTVIGTDYHVNRDPNTPAFRRIVNN